MSYTSEQIQAARQELAKRELARRQQSVSAKPQIEDEIPYTPPPARKGWSGVWEDVKDIPGKVLDYGLEVPGKAFESWGQIFHQPGRALKNLIAGAGETAEAPINLLGAIGPYLKERGITEKIPGFQLPDTGIEKAMGLDQQQPGDELIRQMFMFGGVPKIISRIPGVTNAADRIESMSKRGPLTKTLQELENKHEQVTKAHAEASDQFNALKEFLESQPGFETSKPAALKRKAAESKQKIEKLSKESELIPEHLRVTEEPIAPEKTPLSLVEPIKPAEKAPISEKSVKNAESLLKTAEQNSAEIEQQFGENFLKKGYAHDLPIANAVTAHIEGVKNPKTGHKEGGLKQQIGGIYDQIENDLKDKNVVIPNTKELQLAENSARQLLEGSREFFKTNEEFEAAVQKITKGDQAAKRASNDIIPASDVLSNYRTLRHLSHKIQKEAFSTKVASNKDLQGEMLKKADDFDKSAKNLETILENSNLGTTLTTLKTANKRWRDEITPLYQNKTYRQFLNGLGPDNIIKALRGNGAGQEIIRNIIKKDPELLRNVVGQRYATNPAKLHEFDELTHEYTQHMPEIHEFKKKHFESKQEESKHRMNLEQAKHEYQMAREQADIAHRKGIEQAREQTRLKKETVHKENLAKQEAHAQKTKYFKIQQEIKDLEARHSKLTDSANKMQEKSRKKNISLKEKLEVESQLKDVRQQLTAIQKDISLRNNLLKGVGAIGLGALGIPAYGVAKKLFGGDD